MRALRSRYWMRGAADAIAMPPAISTHGEPITRPKARVTSPGRRTSTTTAEPTPRASTSHGPAPAVGRTSAETPAAATTRNNPRRAAAVTPPYRHTLLGPERWGPRPPGRDRPLHRP